MREKRRLTHSRVQNQAGRMLDEGTTGTCAQAPEEVVPPDPDVPEEFGRSKNGG